MHKNNNNFIKSNLSGRQNCLFWNQMKPTPCSLSWPCGLWFSHPRCHLSLIVVNGEHSGKFRLNCIGASLRPGETSSQTPDPSSNYSLSVAGTHGNVLFMVKSRSSVQLSPEGANSAMQLCLKHEQSSRRTRCGTASLSQPWIKKNQKKTLVNET